jgi:hypothetical protein
MSGPQKIRHNEVEQRQGIPHWARGRRQPRDPKTGYLWPRKCALYRSGHTVHPIQANRSIGQAHRHGHLIAVDGDLITVDFGGEVKSYWNHEVERIVEIVGIAGEVRICEDYLLLRGGGNYCFSILAADESWTPCDYQSISSASPQDLAQRVKTHGGFLVPGDSVETDRSILHA